MVKKLDSGEEIVASTNFYWGRVVREIRREQNISIKQLGRISGVGENTIGNIERRSQNCSVQVLEKILSSLGYELEAMTIDPKPIRFISARGLYGGKGERGDCESGVGKSYGDCV